MGLFSHMCNGCNTSLRGPEKVVIKHIRHGEVLGEAWGSYDEYGGVEENNSFRSNKENHINSNGELIKSEFDFPDSISYDKKMYKKQPVSWREFREIAPKYGIEDLSNKMYKTWEKLKPAPKIIPPRSGVEAWHQKCYLNASEKEKEEHDISQSDPKQGTEKEREEFL